MHYNFGLTTPLTQEGFDPKKPGRAVSTEAEFDLWCEILLSSPKAEVLKTLFHKVVDNGEKRNPLAHPVNLLKNGNATVVRRILKYLADTEAWPEVYQVCQEIIAAAIELNESDAKAIVDEGVSAEVIAKVHSERTQKDVAVLALGAEWFTWSLLVRASKYQESPEE